MPRIAMLEGYAESVPLNTAESAQINAAFNEVIAALRRGVAKYEELVDSLWAPSDWKTGVHSAIGTWNAIIARLDGPSRQDVIAGALEPAKWYRAAKEVSEGMVAQSSTVNEGSYFTLIDDVVADAGKRLAAFGSAMSWGLDTAIGLSKYFFPALIVGGVGIVLWNVYRLTGGGIKLRAGRGLNGYRRRRRRSRK